MRIVKTWCENAEEGMNYLEYNGYRPVCRLGRNFWLVGKTGTVLDDVTVIL